MTTALTSARDAGLINCHVCGRLYPRGAVPTDGTAFCGVCDAALHSRKPGSLTRTWALVIAAFIFYFPANIYPIMVVEISGKAEADTIISGILALFDAGMWEIAVLIVFASITVPMLKLCGLVYLMLSVQFHSSWRPRDRTVLYRIVESIGRWSMIDMFMVSVLVALVKLGAVATIAPGIGATCFAAVVVITMFAAASFDPRLIWDSLEDDS